MTCQANFPRPPFCIDQWLHRNIYDAWQAAGNIDTCFLHWFWWSCTVFFVCCWVSASPVAWIFLMNTHSFALRMSCVLSDMFTLWLIFSRPLWLFFVGPWGQKLGQNLKNIELKSCSHVEFCFSFVKTTVDASLGLHRVFTPDLVRRGSGCRHKVFVRKRDIHIGGKTSCLDVSLISLFFFVCVSLFNLQTFTVLILFCCL